MNNISQKIGAWPNFLDRPFSCRRKKWGLAPFIKKSSLSPFIILLLFACIVDNKELK